MEDIQDYLDGFEESIKNIPGSKLNDIFTLIDNSNNHYENSQNNGYQLDNASYNYQPYTCSPITPPSDYHNQMITPQHANYGNAYHFGNSSTSTPNNTGYYYNYNNSNSNYNNVYNNNNFNNANYINYNNNFNAYNQVNNNNISYSIQQPTNSFQTNSSLSSSSSISPQMINNSYENNSVDYSHHYRKKTIQQNHQANIQRYNKQINKEKNTKIIKIHNDQGIVAVRPSNYSNIKVVLTYSDLWKEFNEYANEMIITKPGRRMFPLLKFSVTGLIPDKRYFVYVDNIIVDNKQWKFQHGEWIVAGIDKNIDELTIIYAHVDSPQIGSNWMKKDIYFDNLKLTNNKDDSNQKQNDPCPIILNSMHRYMPRVHFKDADTENSEVLTFSFQETEFMAVTAYQNKHIKELKINKNPHARGSIVYLGRQNVESSREISRLVDELFSVESKRGRNEDEYNEQAKKKRKIN